MKVLQRNIRNAVALPICGGLLLAGCSEQLAPQSTAVRPVPAMEIADSGDIERRSFPGRARASQESSGGQTKPELLELGEKIYRSGVAERDVAACIACHSPTVKTNH